jgi:hypothetical protein
VNQNAGTFKENLKIQNAITFKIIGTGRRNFIFITYSSDSVGLQNFIEIQGGHVNCCVDLTWNDMKVTHSFMQHTFIKVVHICNIPYCF